MQDEDHPMMPASTNLVVVHNAALLWFQRRANSERKEEQETGFGVAWGKVQVKERKRKEHRTTTV